MPAPYPPPLRSRIAALNRLPRHDPRDPLVRDIVRQRAADACEYCLMPTTGKFEIEHIIPRQRWTDYLVGRYPGLRRAERLALVTPDHLRNFAWACFFCNNAKGGRPRPRSETRLFDPRYDQWPRHFAFSPTKGYGVIIGLTAIGAETVRVLQFHGGGPEGALAERYAAILRGLYPPPWLRAAYHL